MSSSQARKSGALKACLCSHERMSESLWCGCAYGFLGSLSPWILNLLSEVRAQWGIFFFFNVWLSFQWKQMAEGVESQRPTV